MPKRSSSKKLDGNQLAHRVAAIAAGEDVASLKPHRKNPAAVALGRRGGLKGGRARADKLSQDERSQIARTAAQARWQRVREQ